jgi:hypothetical protein
MIENALWFLALVTSCVAAYGLGHADGRDAERNDAAQREREQDQFDMEQAGRMTP